MSGLLRCILGGDALNPGSALGLGRRPGVAPAGELLFFVSPKKPNEKKGDPTVCDPSLRYGHPAVLSSAGVSLELAALRQSRALIRLNLRSSAQTEGVRRKNNTNSRRSQVRAMARTCFGIRFFACPVLAGLSSAGGDGLKILDVRRRRSRQVSKISVSSEQRKLPVAQRRDPDCGSPFFWVLFFGEAKNKCLARRGETRLLTSIEANWALTC
jgi:ankyrin repeat protein